MVDQHQEQQRVDADHHPVGGQAGQGPGDRRALQHRARPVQPAHDHRVGRRSVDRATGVVRAKNAGAEPPRQQQRNQHRNRDQKDDGRGAAIAGPDDPARHEHEVGAQEGHDGADGGGHRVHGHHFFARDHVGQRRRQTGHDEPRQAVGQQRRDQQRNFAGSDGQNHADPGDQHQAAGVRADEHQPSIPPVHQRPGERAQQRVGQEQHRERTRDRHRVGGPVGIEKQRSRERRLEETLTELSRHAHLQQPPEIGQAAHGPPKVHGCARVHLGASHRTNFQRSGALRGAPPHHSTNIYAPSSFN